MSYKQIRSKEEKEAQKLLKIDEQRYRQQLKPWLENLGYKPAGGLKTTFQATAKQLQEFGEANRSRLALGDKKKPFTTEDVVKNLKAVYNRSGDTAKVGFSRQIISRSKAPKYETMYVNSPTLIELDEPRHDVMVDVPVEMMREKYSKKDVRSHSMEQFKYVLANKDKNQELLTYAHNLRSADQGWLLQSPHVPGLITSEPLRIGRQYLNDSYQAEESEEEGENDDVVDNDDDYNLEADPEEDADE